MTIPIVRKRAKKPKTRTGCKTCRQRHIKCDEERPTCRRCRLSGRECAGYDAPRPDFCRSQAVLLPKGSRVGSVRLPTLYPVEIVRGPSMVTTLGMSNVEAYAFDFFRLQTVKQLPGSSWTLSWERLALQMGHHEPAVTHAAIALGAIHRALTFEAVQGPTGIDQEQHSFALRQYNKAMSYVRTYIEKLGTGCSDNDVEVVLLVSLLFFCFEVLHSEDARATMHLRTGLRILYERIRSSHPPAMIWGDGVLKRTVMMKAMPKSHMDVILQTFVRLDGDLTIAGEEEPYLFPVCQERMPSSFYSLDEAMVHLHAIASKTHEFCSHIVCLTDQEVVTKRADYDYLDDDMRNCLACAASRTIPLETETDLLRRMDEVKHELRDWMTALASYRVGRSEEVQHILTQIHFFYIFFVISTCRDPLETLVDRFNDQFHHMVTLIERYVNLHFDGTASPHVRGKPGQYPSATTRQAFTLGTDLVPCISIIAFKARNSSIRRRCITLLRSINLQGVFDSYFLVSFIQLICDLEEKRARELTGKHEGEDFVCRDIPEAARLVEIELSPMHASEFYKADMGRLVYCTSDEDGELSIHEDWFKVMRPETPITHDCQGRADSPAELFWNSDSSMASWTQRFAERNSLVATGATGSEAAWLGIGVER
ncbi:hypothetical protein DOTSEDRAFT_71113 [Dothistroma septosporum NZE10]|uniref:Zn(2)-C6 fungal-type domain-containing protein n=1 Tax=Dothistroma septosporum (strain NZE10 / CBS 128990) TaxID=675120 RepID=N1PPF2_DOTSN|nr:hypothetical protein DOTSEDRAFT_71113 [Dothistroma septosporum NZE10]